jgi:Histidine kinase-, DNA gyrase B-, and HSP90-like ATPase
MTCTNKDPARAGGAAGFGRMSCLADDISGNNPAQPKIQARTVSLATPRRRPQAVRLTRRRLLRGFVREQLVLIEQTAGLTQRYVVANDDVVTIYLARRIGPQLDAIDETIAEIGELRAEKALSAPLLVRHVFKISRLAEFCSQKELVNQTGHAAKDWPLVVLKELVDNALDSTEEAGIAPAIQISVSQDCISVADNGPGIAPETVADIIDYTARVSSREAYVSPTRGAQGNALKTILAMPFALDGECGETVIESQSVAHRIGFSIDRIRQEPRISHVCETSPVKSGDPRPARAQWRD